MTFHNRKPQQHHPWKEAFFFYLDRTCLREAVADNLTLLHHNDAGMNQLFEGLLCLEPPSEFLTHSSPPPIGTVGLLRCSSTEPNSYQVALVVSKI